MYKSSKNRRNLRGGVSLVAPNMTNAVRHIDIKILSIFSVLFLTLFIPQISQGATVNHRQFGAASTVQSGTEYAIASYDYSGEVPGTEGMDEMAVVQTLRHDIQLLDEEIATCERKRKGWVAATVVGGVGVVGTGVAALVQNSKIQDKKSELEQVKSNVASTKQSVQSAQSRFDNM